MSPISRGSSQKINLKYTVLSSLWGFEINPDTNFKGDKLKLDFSLVVDLLAIQGLGTFCVPGVQVLNGQL